MDATNENDIEKGSEPPTQKKVEMFQDDHNSPQTTPTITNRKKFSSTVHKYIQNRSSSLEDVDHNNEKRSIDAARIQSALHDAVAYSYGILAAEVFVCEEKGVGGDGEGIKIPKLVRPEGGWYCDPHYRKTISSSVNGDGVGGALDIENKIKSKALARLEDGTREDYIPPGPVTPGVDLAGVLWSQYSRGRTRKKEMMHHVSSSTSLSEKFSVSDRAAENTNLSASPSLWGRFSIRGGEDTNVSASPSLWERLSVYNAQKEYDQEEGRGENEASGMRRTNSKRGLRQSLSMIILKNPLQQNNPTQTTSSSPSSQLPFRNLEFLLDDPDTAKSGPRLETLFNAGFANALAMPYHIGEYSGIVIYYARENVTKDKHVSSVENATYLRKSADIIGSIVSSIDSRRASVLKKHEICTDVCQRIRKEMATNGKCTLLEKTKNEKNQSSSSSPLSSTWFQQKRDYTTQKIITYIHKCIYGGGNQIPPPMQIGELIYTWLGAFLGLLLLSGMNELAKDYSNNDYSLLIGPFGAMMTLLYGLSSAPASQPRNAILGQVIAGAISLCFTYIPEENLSVCVRTALGPAFSVTAMVALGIPHPPAGAHSVLYASGKYDWTFYLLVVIGSIISVFPAVLVNNLSTKRHYPTYWGYWTRFLPGGKGFKKENDSNTNSMLCCSKKTNVEKREEEKNKTLKQ